MPYFHVTVVGRELDSAIDLSGLDRGCLLSLGRPWRGAVVHRLPDGELSVQTVTRARHPAAARARVEKRVLRALKTRFAIADTTAAELPSMRRGSQSVEVTGWPFPRDPDDDDPDAGALVLRRPRPPVGPTSAARRLPDQPS